MYPWNEAFEDLFREHNIVISELDDFWGDFEDIVNQAISEQQEIESYTHPSVSDIRDDYWKRKMDNAEYVHKSEMSELQEENKELERVITRLKWRINDLKMELNQ